MPFCPGRLPRSTRRTEKPFSARARAAAEPAGPAPTTATSYFSIRGPPEDGRGRKEPCLGALPRRVGGRGGVQFWLIQGVAHPMVSCRDRDILSPGSPHGTKRGKSGLCTRVVGIGAAGGGAPGAPT